MGRVGNSLDRASNAINAMPLLHQGGMVSSKPSVSSAVVIFSVVLLAFSGYVMYTLRKTISVNKEETDDSPPDPRAVRRTSKTPGQA
jgi:uncharacterized iron-regulated membrane protein